MSHNMPAESVQAFQVLKRQFKLIIVLAEII